MTFYEKLNALCHTRGFAVSNIGDAIPALSVTRGTVSKWKNGAMPRPTTVRIIASYFGVDVAQLQSDDTPAPAEGEEVLQSLRRDRIRMIPLYESVSAGFGAYACSNIADYVPIYIESDMEARDTLCIRVVGDSMYPKIESGDIIRVHRQETVESGSVAVVIVDGEQAMVKKIVLSPTLVELHSFNAIYPPLLFPGEEMNRVRVVGLVRSVEKML